jgi:hypothetical protein
MAVVVAALAMSSCGSGSSTVASSSSTVATTGPKSLQEAARTFAAAYLTGSVDDIAALMGPECLDGPSVHAAKDQAAAAAQLRTDRADMEQQLGAPLGAIKVTGVSLRNVTASRGEAKVDYDLPKAGNDNWVTYARHDGVWKVADCAPPIGESSTSGTFPPITYAP